VVRGCAVSMNIVVSDRLPPSYQFAESAQAL
jgi:hypothetical protein